MKKITLVVCLLFIAFVNAQDDAAQTTDKLTFQKGTQFVNANLSLGASDSNFTSNTQNTDTDRFNFNINSSYSYAVSDNFFIGLGLGYSHSKQEDENQISQTNSELKANTYNIFPYVRYYKGIGKKLAFFVQGETRFSHSINEHSNDEKWKSNSLFVGVRPGLVLMLNKNLSLETTIGSLGYTSANSDNDANNFESKSNSFDLSLNTSNLFFGLNYYF